MGKIQKNKQIAEDLRPMTFVGRKKEFECFWHDYEAHDEESDTWDASIINYYGMPGIGKTEFANSLYLQHIEKGLKAVNFPFIETQSFFENMLDLRSCLNTELGYVFPSFDLAYTIYCKRSGRKIDLKNRKNILSSKWMEAVYPFLNLSPGINIVAAVVQAIKPFESEIQRSFSEEDLFFLRESSEQVYNKLPYYFSVDLYNNIHSQNKPTTILIDNIEPFINDKGFKTWFIGDNGLWRQQPNVIWCVFTQRPIDEECNDEDKTIQNTCIDVLNSEDVNLLLETKGISKDYYDEIYTASEGIPVYIDLIIRTYFHYVREKKLGEFNAELKRETLVDRYLKCLSNDEIKVLKVMAFLEAWDDELMISLLQEIGTDIEAYTNLVKHSYVRKSTSGYYLHSVISEVMKANISHDFYYVLSQSAKKIDKEGKHIHYRFIEIKAVLSSIEDEELLTHETFKLFPLLDKLRQSLVFEGMYRIHRIVCMRFQKCKHTNIAESLTYYMYARMFIETGFELRAYDLISYANKIAKESVCPACIKKRAYEAYIFQLKEEFANALQNIGKYSESKDIRKSLLDEMIKREGIKSFRTLSTKQNYLCNLVYIDSERVKAIGKIKGLLHQRERIVLRHSADIQENNTYIVYALSALSIGYYLEENDKLAIEYAYKAYQLSLDLLGVDDIRTQTMITNLANRLMDIKEYTTVVELLESLYKIWSNRLPKDSELLLSIRYSLGVAYGASGRPEKGEVLLRENYQYAFDTFGRSDKKTLRYKKEYSLCRAEAGFHEESIEALKDCKQIYEKVYGCDGSEQLRNIIHALIIEYKLTHNQEKEEEEIQHFNECGYTLCGPN